MPWSTKDVAGFTKAATTDKQKRQWIAVANSALRKCLDDGGSTEDCEASAIRQGNASVKEGDVSEVTVTVGVPMMSTKIPDLPPGTLTSENDTVLPPERVIEQDPPETCVCPDCGHEQDKERAIPCRSVECSECGAKMVAKIEEPIEEIGKRVGAAQLRKLDAARDAINEFLVWANYEDVEEEEVSEFIESASGHVMGLAEATPLPDSVVPLHLDAVLIEPGWGNKKDGHFYPREVLERDASVFEGVKMFETDHRQSEKSTRTWVSTVKEISGFTDDGAPIGRISVHDRDFAERLLALEADDLLGKMECSILAGGTAKKGKIDGKKAKIVEAITEADSVDWVTRAGAGGRALALAETEEGSMEDETQTDIVEEEEIEEVAISEDEEPEAPVPESLSEERVTERLDGTNLPKASKARLSEVDYADDETLETAVKAEIAYVKALTGSGQPFGMDGQPQSKGPRTEEQRTDDFNQIMREVGGREV